MLGNIEKIKQNIEVVQSNINSATRRAARLPSDVKLMVVTKTHPIEVVQSVIAAGVIHLGENYIEEAQAKINTLGDTATCSWHMIGHVQSRKAKMVVEYIDTLHSLDSLKLAIRLNAQAEEQGRTLPVLLEYNVSGEVSKSGWQLGDKTNWDDLLPDVEAILSLHNLNVRGLMTLPPYDPNPEVVRPFFRRLRQFLEYLQSKFGTQNWKELSMGMSGDYEVAIEEGATWVRIGQAILGPRS